MKPKRNPLKKYYIGLLSLTIITGYVIRLFSSTPELTYYIGSERVYAESAQVNSSQNNPVFPTEFERKNFESLNAKINALSVDQDKVSRVRNYLASRGAPLADEAEYLVKVADDLGIDYRLVAAISIIESSGGIHCYRAYNAWGWGGQGGAYTFNNWQEGIYTVSYGLKVGYYDRGATTPRQIGRSYNPDTWEQWAGKVEWVMGQM